jgi:hypothetical protein
MAPIQWGETAGRYADQRIAYQVNSPAQFTDRSTWLLDRGAASWSLHQGVWLYMPDDTGTPDGVTRTAAVGGGNWVRAAWGKPGATGTSNYYVQSTGDDANSGLASGASTALTTPQEVLRRIGTEHIATNNITVHLADNYTPSFAINVNTDNGWTLNFRGTRNVLNSYVLAARTAWAASTIGDYTLTGAPNLTTLGYAKTRHATVQGSTLQSPIGKDLTSGKFRGTWFDTNAYTKGEPTATTDTIDVYSMPKLGGDVYVQNNGYGYVQFTDLDVGNVGAPHSVQCIAGSHWFQGCNVHGLDVYEGVWLCVLAASQTFDCRSYGLLQTYAALCDTGGGAALAARGRGQVEIIAPTVVQGETLTVGHSQDGPGDVNVLDWLAFADYPAAAVVVYPGSTVRASVKIWGTSSVSAAPVGYKVFGGGAIRYASGLAPGLGGTLPTAQTIVGGTTVALASLPSFNANNGACIVVDQ